MDEFDVTDRQAIALYDEFRRHYQQRTKPWDELSLREQEGWWDFAKVASAIVSPGCACDRERYRKEWP